MYSDSLIVELLLLIPHDLLASTSCLLARFDFLGLMHHIRKFLPMIGIAMLLLGHLTRSNECRPLLMPQCQVA